jgi:bifunctional non-homologous end joining protein LigD
MADALSSYRAKRDLEATPEPSGGAPEGQGGERFVIQEHHARRLHWDLRLERDGVLASWALPKGVPGHPEENRLAVRTEDHPLEYLEFHGEIPAGSYGAGTMTIWDRGTYECEKFRDDEVIVTLRGERVEGRYALFHTRGKDWMIHRMDPPADPGAEPMPEEIAPMLARNGDLPRDDESYGYEIKWDGVRAVAHVDAGHVTLTGRNGTDFTPRYPEVRAMADALGSRRLVLDGEIVAFDSEGRPSFERLQSRMHLASDSAVRRRMRDLPVAYVAFDLLWLEGRSTCSLPYAERRRLLEELDLNGPSWRPTSRAGGRVPGSR